MAPPQQHRLLNQFLFNDRFMQTSYDRRREKGTITEPPATTNASGVLPHVTTRGVEHLRNHVKRNFLELLLRPIVRGHHSSLL